MSYDPQRVFPLLTSMDRKTFEGLMTPESYAKWAGIPLTQARVTRPHYFVHIPETNRVVQRFSEAEHLQGPSTMNGCGITFATLLPLPASRRIRRAPPRPNIPKKLRWAVMNRDGFRCRYCGSGRDGAALEIDHVVPSSRGGETTINNLVTSCRDCNQGKSGDPSQPPPLATPNNLTECVS